MKIPIRKVTLILAIILLVCAVVAVIKSAPSSADGKGTGREPTGGAGEITNAEGRSGQSAGEAAVSKEGEPIGRTKVRERPIETALDKKRRERKRLVENLQECHEAGLAERHPTVVKLTGDLRKVEEELAAAGDGTAPTN